MADLFGTHVEIEVRINKQTGKFVVTVLDHGEKMGCAEFAEDGEAVNAKIVKWISEQISGAPAEEAQLTKKGEQEVRQAAVTAAPVEEEEEEGYNPLDDSPLAANPYDAGGYGI